MFAPGSSLGQTGGKGREPLIADYGRHCMCLSMHLELCGRLVPWPAPSHPKRYSLLNFSASKEPHVSPWLSQSIWAPLFLSLSPRHCHYTGRARSETRLVWCGLFHYPSGKAKMREDSAEGESETYEWRSGLLPCLVHPFREGPASFRGVCQGLWLGWVGAQASPPPKGC